MRHVVACLAVAGICWTGCATGPVARAETKPNIVLILVDDLGWSDLACYGNGYHRTPHIDRLAAEGLRFTSGYAAAPICSASRASMLTGKSPARLGFEFVTKNESGHQQLDMDVPLRTPKFTLNLPLSEITVAEYLADVGYRTAFFGKWHLNQHYQRRYLAWHPDFGPRRQGFSVAREDFGDHPYAWSKKSKPEELSDGVFPKDSMINRVVDFIRDQRESETPFFLTVSSFYVHTPVRNRCRWLVERYQEQMAPDSPNRDKRLQYAAFVETLDHHVGTMLDAIDDSGFRENTLVVFISDNGGHPEYCSNAPLRGSKWNLYEGGIRVPFIVRWPNTIPPGVTCDTPVAGYDLLPTLVDVAGSRVTSENPIDGISFKRAFADQDWRPSRFLLWHFPYYHPESTFSAAIDQVGIDDFAVSKTRPQSAFRKDRYKLIEFTENGRVELYDLESDASEQNDLSKQLPDVALELQTQLRHALEFLNARRATPAH